MRCWCLVVAMLSVLPANSWAQDRSDLLESFLKSLVESQLNRNQNRGRPPRPPGVVQPPAPTQQLLQARQQIAALDRETAKLVNALKLEERTTPQVRPLLADALSLNALADVLEQNSQQAFVVDDLYDQVQEFDRNWRVLSHRLKQVPNLGRVCLRAMDGLSTASQQLNDHLGIQPQLDRNELVRLSGAFTSAYRHLIEDVRYGTARVNDRAQLLAEGHALNLKVYQAMSLIERSNYDRIVAAFQDCQKDWYAFSAKLRTLNSPRIQRGVLEVEEIGRQIADQLWLSTPMDRSYILQLAKTVEDDVHHVLERVSLVNLIDHPQPEPLIRSARELDSVTHAFTLAAENTHDIKNLVWDFRVYDVQWREFSDQLRRLKSPELDLRITDVDRNLDLLQKALQLQPTYDRRAIQNLAASLDELSSQLGSVVDRIVVRSNSYPGTLRNQFSRNMDNLHHEAHDLHDLFLRHGSDQQIQAVIRNLAREWDETKTLLRQVERRDQQQLLQTMAQIEPLMVKLQVVFRD